MRIEGLQIADESGRIIEKPTPTQIRLALLQLLEATGSNVIQLTVDGYLIAYVMAGNDEVSDALADSYSRHLLEVAEHFVESAKSARQDYLARAKAKRGEAS